MLIINSFFEDLDFDMEPDQPRRRRFGRRGGGGGDDGGRRGGGGDDDGGGGDDHDDVFATQGGSTSVWDDNTRRDDDDDEDGGGRGRGGARGQGLQRLLILAGVLVLVLGIGIWQVRSCQRQQEVDGYRDYAKQANAVAKQSTDLGKQFGDAWIKQGQQVDDFVATLSDLATKQKAVADSAGRVQGPGALDQIDTFETQAMQLRATGLKAVADAVQKANADAGKDGEITDEGVRGIIKAAARLNASDAVYQDSFRTPAQAALKDAGIDGTTIEESQFVSDDTIDLLTADRIKSLIGAWKLGSGGGTGGTAAQCDDGQARGTQLVSVVVSPADATVWSNDGSVADAPEVQVSTDNQLKVALINSGDVTLTQVQIKATIGDEKLPTQVVPVLDVDKETTVSFPFAADAVDFAGETRVTATVEPDACESNKENNLAKFNVLFQLGGQ